VPASQACADRPELKQATPSIGTSSEAAKAFTSALPVRITCISSVSGRQSWLSLGCVTGIAAGDNLQLGGKCLRHSDSVHMLSLCRGSRTVSSCWTRIALGGCRSHGPPTCATSELATHRLCWRDRMMCNGASGRRKRPRDDRQYPPTGAATRHRIERPLLLDSAGARPL